MLDTDQLRSFIAIVDTGSFTNAAERVNKTQSSVSMHVRRLEERLACELFVKHGRGVRLSDEGEKLVDLARKILSLETTALSSVGKNGPTGRVRFGIPDDYAEPFLPKIVNQLARAQPLLELSIICDSSIALAERLASREIDMALVTDCGAVQGVELIREEPLVWVGGLSFLLDEDAPVPLALGSPTCDWRLTAERVLAEAARPARIALVSNNFSAIAPMVVSGAALTVLPISAVRSNMRIMGPSYRLPPLPNTKFGLLRGPGHQSEAVLALGAAIRDSFN